MAITSVDQIAAGLAVSQNIKVLKIGGAAKAIGAFQSLWKAAGYPGAGSDAPAYTAGSGYTCSAATAGAMPYVNASVQNYLAKFAASASIAATYYLFDRLWSCSGMGFASGTYAVTTPGSLPARITDAGVGVRAFIENFVAAGAASGTLTLNYLNTASAAKAGVVSVVSAPVAGQIQPIPLAVGDSGISQVTNAVTSNTWTSGSFGITLAKLIAVISVPVAGVGATLDWAGLGLPRIPADACLWLVQHASATTATTVAGSLDIIDK